MVIIKSVVAVYLGINLLVGAFFCAVGLKTRPRQKKNVPVNKKER